MNAVEYAVVAPAVAAALLYLAHRARRRFRGRGCCGSCPVAAPKIRLADRKTSASTNRS